MNDAHDPRPDRPAGAQRRRPRDWAEEPDAFGRTEGLKWRDATTVAEQAERRAAELQNLYAVLMRRRARKMGLNLTAYARKAGVDYGRLTKIMRGSAKMSFEDIGFADVVLREVSELGRQDGAEAQRGAGRAQRGISRRESASRRPLDRPGRMSPAGIRSGTGRDSRGT